MSLTLPRGGISLAEYRLALTLANCAEWIAWTGSADAAAAMQRIYFHGLPKPAEDRDSYTIEELVALRPFAIVSTERYRIGRSASEAFVDSGLLWFQIEDNIPADIANDLQEIGRRFSNRLGLVLGTEAGTTGLIDLAGHAPDEDHIYLAVDELDMSSPVRADEKMALKNGDCIWAEFYLPWGRT